MKISRRTALKATSVVPIIGRVDAQQQAAMYGLIGKIKANPGKRDELAAILLQSTPGLTGCLSYVVAKDTTDPDALWITEVWATEADHQASLTSPSVKEAIAKGRPLIAAFDVQYKTQPIGGVGLHR